MDITNLESLIEQSGSIVPLTDEKKSITGWAKYQAKAANFDQINEWFKSGKFKSYGLIMGYGDYHVIDFDQKNVSTCFSSSVFQEVWNEIPDDLRCRLLVQRTLNAGEHIVYRSAIEAKSSTLAKNPESNKKIIETIGSKNYIRIYDDVPSGSWSEVQTISPKEHEWLINKSRQVGARIFGDQTLTASTLDANAEPVKRDKKSYRETINFVSASAVQIEKSKIDVTEDYDDWIKLGYAISNEVGEEGREYFHKISSANTGYDDVETDSVYNSILKGGRKKNNTSGATLRHLMTKYGVAMPKKGNSVAYKTEAAIAHIKSKGLRLNEFTNKVELSNGDLLTDRDLNDLYIELRKQNLSISKGDVASMINSSEIELFDPLKLWMMLSELSANDHVIDDFLDCLTLKDSDPKMQQFIRSMVVKWLLQIPAMINDGVPPRLVLVSIGNTYIGKSELFRRLLPIEFLKYFAESGLDREKDSEILMSEHLIVNVDELAGIMKSSKQVERFKSLASAQYFTLRTPYGKINERFQRKAILCGTSNKLDIIMDHDTGNSRIIPLELIDIDKAKYNSIDRNALFGALSKRYKEVGAKFLYLTVEEREMLQRKSDDHTVVNIEEELILRNFKPARNDLECFKTVSEICDILTDHTSHIIDPRKISRELYKHGFMKDRKRVNGSISALSGFYVKQKYDIESIKDKFYKEL